MNIPGLRAVRGQIFDIQRYSIHDGPGIRTTVFLSGCPLRCWWCQNPEALGLHPQLFFDARKCAGCAACVAACPNHAIALKDGRSHTNRTLCDALGRCVEVCPHEARSLAGRRVTAGEVFDEAAADSIFYEDSGGGVTLSGGDPVFQPEFAEALLSLCRSEGLHTTLDTSGHAAWPVLSRLAGLADLVLYDLKHMDPQAHCEATGVSNEIILENARRVCHELGTPMRVRLPVIPGVNDSIDNIETTARFVATALAPSVPVHLISYHRLGLSKRELLEQPAGRETEVPTQSALEQLAAILRSFNLQVQIGG